MKSQPLNNQFAAKMMATMGFAIVFLLTDVSSPIRAAETEIPPTNYVSSYSGAVTNDYPTNLAWWSEFRPTGDYGAMVNEHVTWDGTTFEYSNVLIFPEADTNGATVFHTNSGTSYWSVSTNGVWTYSWKVDNGGSDTNLPSLRPDWLFRRAESNRIQTGHVTITESILADNTSEYTTNTVTNATTLMLNTGKAIDTTYPHLFQFKVTVWDTTDPANEVEYSPGVISELGITLNPQGCAFTNLDDNAVVNITPSLVGVASNDTRFKVEVDKVKVRFGAQAGKMCEGYDPKPGTTTNHATSLAIGGTNQITELQIPADWALDLVELKVTGDITVSQTNNFTSRTTALTIISTGTNPATAAIEAQYKTNHVTLAKLAVEIMQWRTIPIDFWRIQDTNSLDTLIGDTPSNASLIQTLNSIFRQACITFTDASAESTDWVFHQAYDTNLNGKVDFGGTSTEFDSVTNVLLNTSAKFRLLIIADSDASYNDTNVPPNLDHVRGRQVDDYGMVFVKYCTGDIGDVLAHEVGHLLSFAQVIDNSEHDTGEWPLDNGTIQEHLMRSGKPFQKNQEWIVPWPGHWLRREDWKFLNNKAQ